jgi:hypothetical protein
MAGDRIVVLAAVSYSRTVVAMAGDAIMVIAAVSYSDTLVALCQ